jgi:hypothetical protein
MATDRDKSGDRELSDKDLAGIAGGLSGDDLSSAFRKLSLTDPNNNPDTHEALKEVADDTRRTQRS